MPLPPPSCSRTPSHQRSIAIRTHAREDGLWDIEGHLTDTWPHDMPMHEGTLRAGDPIHSMWLRLTVDRTATVVAATAVTDAGPYGAACATINPAYADLVGVQIARGWRNAIRDRFGRTAGCTHLNELAGAMGTAALQALWPELKGDPDVKPFSIDGCHALKSSGPQVARFYPRWYRPADEASSASSGADPTGTAAAPRAAPDGRTVAGPASSHTAQDTPVARP